MQLIFQPFCWKTCTAWLARLGVAQPPNRSTPFVQGCYFGWVFELSSALGCFENPGDTLQLRALWTSLDLVRAIIVGFNDFWGVETTKQLWFFGNLLRHWVSQPGRHAEIWIQPCMTICPDVWTIDALVNRDCAFSIWVWKQARYAKIPLFMIILPIKRSSGTPISGITEGYPKSLHWFQVESSRDWGWFCWLECTFVVCCPSMQLDFSSRCELGCQLSRKNLVQLSNQSLNFNGLVSFFPSPNWCM